MSEVLLFIAIGLLLVAVGLLVKGRRVLNEVQAGIKTVNGTLLGEYGDAIEARRVRHLPASERTENEQHLLDKLDAGERRHDPSGP